MNFTSPRIIFYLILILYAPLQIYLYRRLGRVLNSRIRNPGRARLYRWATLGFFILMFIPFSWIAVFGLLPHEPYPWPIRQDLLFLSIWAVGSTGSALVLLSYELVRRSAAVFAPRPAAVDSERRRFLKAGAGVFAAAPFVLSGYGTLLGRRRFEIDHLELPVNGLSSALSGLTIVQLTDIHVGPFMPPQELAAYVEAINRLDPDLIALTGDFVAGSSAEAGPCAETLAGLRARYGVYGCLGNHDVYADIEDELTRLFTAGGMRMLRNEAVSLPIKDTKLNVLGIDDLRWGVPDLPRALDQAARDPGEVRLLLSHRPEIFPTAAGSGIDVVLAGHYHGGQVKLGPESANLSIARFITPYAEGLFHLSRRRPSAPARAEDSTLFVGRGIGITGLPIRINCPPQIAHLTLKKV